MIILVYTGPCVYDPRQIGWADAQIGYTGEDPVKTAERYVHQFGPKARLQSVELNGRVVLRLRF